MRVPSIVSGFAVLAALWAPSVVRGQVSTVPAVAQIVRSIAVTGASGERAVIYRSNGLRLGITVSTGGVSKLVWSRSLPALPARISSPGPAGLIQGIVRFAGSGRAQVFAYVVRSGRLSSAIAGHPRGQITADDGGHFHGLSFTVGQHDTAHQGSVPYRFETTFAWQEGTYRQTSRIHVPDLATSAYPVPNATAVTKAGNVVLMHLELADNEYLRQRGLMFRTSLDPDSGMIFVWTSDVLDSFWMENTYIPLSIAFLAADGTVQEIQDMSPLTTNSHTPQKPYRYAIEANLGFWSVSGIAVGDKLTLHLTT